MATPRRRFFVSVPEAFALRDDLTNDELATVLRLLAWLNQRYWRDGLTVAQGCAAVLGSGTIALITRNRRTDLAPTSLQRIGDVVGMSVERRGDVASIRWPKCAELLGWVSRNAPDRAPTYTDSTLSQHYVSVGPEGEGLDRIVSGLVGVPRELSRADRARFRRWLAKNLGPFQHRAGEFERDCLAHYAKAENAEKAAATDSWLARCEGWASEAWAQEVRERKQAGLWPARVRGRR